MAAAMMTVSSFIDGLRLKFKARPEWRGAKDVGMQTEHAIPRPLQGARYAFARSLPTFRNALISPRGQPENTEGEQQGNPADNTTQNCSNDCSDDAAEPTQTVRAHNHTAGQTDYSAKQPQKVED